jgi:hypothetical protein
MSEREIADDAMRAGKEAAMKIAAHPYAKHVPVAQLIIAKAIMAERERCAKVAEARIAAGFADLPETGDAYLQGSISSATIIATSIRQGSPK